MIKNVLTVYDVDKIVEQLEECFKRLAEYEKIGLTPQQIVEIDKLYQEKCEEVARFELIKTATYAGQQVYVKKNSKIGKEG